MYNTYGKAIKVLVLDAKLCQKEPVDDLKAVVELTCSNWMRKLWTLQEGILRGRRLHALSTKGPLDLWKSLQQLCGVWDNIRWTSHPIISYAIRLGLSHIFKT